jgi:hypothetical protein
MAKTRKRGRRNANGNGNVHPTNAPTGNMQQVSTWQLNEFVPILVPSGTTYNVDQPAVV